MKDLNETRKQIDAIDKKIVDLFEERMKVADDVAEFKLATKKPVYDPARESEKLDTLTSLADSNFNKTAVKELFTQIMSISRKYQYRKLASPLNESDITWTESFINTGKTIKSAFFGVSGTYTERAMNDFFSGNACGVPKPSFEDVCRAVSEGEVDFGVLPIENTTSGSLADIYDLLIKFDNKIVGEKIEKIDHALLGVPGAKLSDITDIYSHAQPLLQCSSFIAKNPDWHTHVFGSTADSANKVAADKNIHCAAIASRQIADRLGLIILRDDIADFLTNATRFIILSKKNTYLTNADKVSICFEIPHKSGSLYNLLSNFIYNGLNMTRIESRPIPGKPFEYRFFIDFTGSLKDPGVVNALTGIKAESNNLVILGTYL